MFLLELGAGLFHVRQQVWLYENNHMSSITIFTWLAVAHIEDDEGPPFSHKNPDEVEAPPYNK